VRFQASGCAMKKIWELQREPALVRAHGRADGVDRTNSRTDTWRAAARRPCRDAAGDRAGAAYERLHPSCSAELLRREAWLRDYHRGLVPSLESSRHGSQILPVDDRAGSLVRLRGARQALPNKPIRYIVRCRGGAATCGPHVTELGRC